MSSLINFDPERFLSTIGGGRSMVTVSPKQKIFVQGDDSDAVYYIQKGKVKLAVVSPRGKEAIIGTWTAGEFFGDGCLAGQSKRMGTASAMTACTLLRIEKKAMMNVLHREYAFADMFVRCLLKRNVRYEEDLVDQLFNSSEKRLARALLLLAQFGAQDAPEAVIPKISQEALAEMVGTTRSRVSFFMHKFRKLSLIDYDGGEVRVRRSLLSIVLHD